MPLMKDPQGNEVNIPMTMVKRKLDQGWNLSEKSEVMIAAAEKMSATRMQIIAPVNPVTGDTAMSNIEERPAALEAKQEPTAPPPPVTSGDYVDPSGHVCTLRANTNADYLVLVARKKASGWTDVPPSSPTAAE